MELPSLNLIICAVAFAIILLSVWGIRTVLTGADQAELPAEASSSGESMEAQDVLAGTDEEPQRVSANSFDYDAFDSLSGSVTTFSLLGGGDPSLSSEDEQRILGDMEGIRSYGAAGFVFVDLESGCGLSCNADTALYTASAFKMPYATYICQHLDAGDLNLEDLCTVTTSMDGTLVPGQSYSVSDLLQDMISISGNDSFVALRNSYDQLGIDSWLAELDVYDASSGHDQYPVSSARSLIKLWANTYDYFQSGTATSQWLMDLAANTNISFIREALAEQGATVLNKAGWFTTDDMYSRCVADAGIIQDGEDHAYLMAILTNMSYDWNTAMLVKTLAADLYDLRGDLVQ